MNIIRLDETTSTNDYLKAVDASDGIVVATAKYQTAGRGQSGAWISDYGRNLLFSMKLMPTRLKASDGFIISQANALALNETARQYISDVWIKWPNDIYSHGKKICGTLIENTLAGKDIYHSIIGTGLNVNQAEFPEGLAAPASSLASLSAKGEDIPVEEVLHEFLSIFQDYYRQIETGNLEIIRSRYHESLYLLNTEHPFADINGRFTGTIQGVENDGHLIIRDHHGNIRRYGFKEVRLITSE